ncbi:MAG: hypothetical protein HZA93_14885 [Verrucomicrobia bacterium]|nr:hypothetical protein [Verrucomicrobiota bacterium]
MGPLAENHAWRLRPPDRFALLRRLAPALLLSGCALVAAPERGRTAYAADTQSLYEAPATGTVSFLREWVTRETTHVPITTYVQDAALPDICLYDSKAGEVYGERFGDDLSKMKLEIDRNMTRAIRALRQEGTDVLRVVSAALRPRGLEVLAGVRMSDTHHRRIAFDEPLCPRVTLEHPEWVIRQPDLRENETALDYSIPAVREHRMAIIRELAGRPELDGVELNFVRWAKHFPRDQGAVKAPVMTEFVGRVRAELDRAAAGRGAKRPVLGVRVPEGLRECWLAGVDVETWVRDGWIDYVIASPFNESTPQLAVEEFARFTTGRTQLLVSMGDMIGGTWSGPPKITGRGLAQVRDSYSGMLMTPAEARAIAGNFYAWGADGIGFWNVGTKMGVNAGKLGATPELARAQHERLWSWMNAALDRPAMEREERCYHFLPLFKWAAIPAPPSRNYAWYGQGQSPLGTLTTQILRFPPEDTGVRQTYRFRMADGRDGRAVNALVRFRIFHLEPADQVEFDLNCRPVPLPAVRPTQLDVAAAGLPGMHYEIQLADWRHFRGDNVLGIIVHRAVKRAAVPYLEELEVIVR